MIHLIPFYSTGIKFTAWYITAFYISLKSRTCFYSVRPPSGWYSATDWVIVISVMNSGTKFSTGSFSIESKPAPVHGPIWAPTGRGICRLNRHPYIRERLQDFAHSPTPTSGHLEPKYDIKLMDTISSICTILSAASQRWGLSMSMVPP